MCSNAFHALQPGKLLLRNKLQAAWGPCLHQQLGSSAGGSPDWALSQTTAGLQGSHIPHSSADHCCQ